MQQDTGYRALLDKRTRRTLAAMLSEKEEIIDPYLPDDVSQELRKMILDYFNEFKDFCFDLMDSMDQGMIVNDLVFERLQNIEMVTNQLAQEKLKEHGRTD